MFLKRLHSKDANGKPVAVAGVKVLRHGKKQKFTHNLIEQGVGEGWLTMGDGKITIRAEGGDITYRVTRTPGFYCCHCGAKLPGDPRVQEGAGEAAERAAHVAKEHPGVSSPDPENPSGYMGTTSIKGVKE